MNNLGDYLNKFKKVFQNAQFQKDAVRSVIRNIVKIELGEKDFDVKNYTVTLNVSPVIKNEIFMRKQKILEALKSALGPKAPHDIR
jgi:hypothetical protein